MSATWRQRGGAALRSHSFLTLVGEEGEWSTSCYGHFTPRKNTGIRWTGGWVDPRKGLDIAEKRNPTGIRNGNFSARNQFVIQTTLSCFSQDYAQSLMRLYAKTNRKGTTRWTHNISSYYNSIPLEDLGITVRRLATLMLRILVMSFLSVLSFIRRRPLPYHCLISPYISTLYYLSTHRYRQIDQG